jgi:hypothetical protein
MFCDIRKKTNLKKKQDSNCVRLIIFGLQNDKTLQTPNNGSLE